MLKVVGYVRVSTEEQSKEGVSLDAQKSKVEQFARLHELDLVGLVEDAGVSAKSLDRPGLARVLGMLDAGDVQGVIVTKLDRLSRSVRDFADLIDRYFTERGGRQLFSVADSIDSRSAGGRLVLNVLMSVAQWERETISERTRDALAYKKSQGRRVGHVPLGFDLGPDGRSLVPNLVEQAAKEIIPELRKSGMTYAQISDWLIEHGMRPKNGAAAWSCGSLFFHAHPRARRRPA